MRRKREGAEVPWWECSGLEGKPQKHSWAPELWVPHLAWSLWSSCDLQSAILASSFTGSSFPLGGHGLRLPHDDSDPAQSQGQPLPMLIKVCPLSSPPEHHSPPPLPSSHPGTFPLHRNLLSFLPSKKSLHRPHFPFQLSQHLPTPLYRKPWRHLSWSQTAMKPRPLGFNCPNH